MILIVAPETDSHAASVVKRLRHLGASVLRIEVGDFPSRALTVRVGDLHKGRVDPATLEIDGLRGELTAVWYRRVGWPRVDMRLSPSDRAFAFSETQAALISVSEILDGCTFAVNPLQRALMTERGAGKLHQLEVAREHLLAIPRTVATNDPGVAKSFVASCERGAVYKPFLAPVSEEAGRKRTVFTNKISDADLAKLEGVRSAPCLFQELVPKAYEVRATIMGERIFGTEIRSQDSTRSMIDFRRDYGVDHRPHEIPVSVKVALRGVMASLGLRFGCVDLIVTPDDEYVFLEVNQQGQWLWTEERTGQPLLANFCAFLMQARDDFDCDAGVHAPGIFPDM